MQKSNNPVLVTGSAGFIGSNIVDKFLQEGFPVIGIDNLKRGNKKNINPKSKFYNVDLNNRKAIEKILKKHKPEKIIHLASTLVDVSLSIKYPWLSQRDITMTSGLLECARNFNLRQIVFASSANVYGNQVTLPINEKAKINPLSPYGLSKAAIEDYIRYFSKRYGIIYTIFRYFNVYGEKQSKKSKAAIPSFIRGVLKNKVINVRGGNQTRDFVYVRDVADANFIAVKNEIQGTFNIGTSKQTQVNKVIATIGKLLEIEPKVKQAERKGFDCNSSQASILKAKKYLKWEPKTKIEDGLKKTIDFYAQDS
jgi:UDP-glucose 4-epimerase